MYNCRQVQCPRCNHNFMWIEYADLPPSHNVYRRKGAVEELGSTHCPKCNCQMIVPSDSKTGISVEDESVELRGTVRGL